MLDSTHNETGVGLDEHKFSEEARDFVEEWLYQLSDYYRIHVWSDADLAITALPNLVNLDGLVANPEGDPVLLLLRSAIERLTTKKERRAFLRDTEESDAEPEKESDINRRAAFKLSRVLADPRTPAELRTEIGRALCEFANAADVQVTHAALARRGFQLMCDAQPKGKVRECRKARGALLALLDSIPDEKGSEG